jgi:hypothetical protein
MSESVILWVPDSCMIRGVSEMDMLAYRICLSEVNGLRKGRPKNYQALLYEYPDDPNCLGTQTKRGKAVHVGSFRILFRLLVDAIRRSLLRLFRFTFSCT